MNETGLIELAEKARENAYSPYSGFTVGAALLCADGTVYTGCNVENASYPATVCAERVAVGKAISEGKRRFEAIAVVGGRQNEPATTFFMPCGICRQVLREFCTDAFRVFVSNGKEIRSMTMKELLPGSFTGDAMR